MRWSSGIFPYRSNPFFTNSKWISGLYISTCELFCSTFPVRPCPFMKIKKLRTLFFSVLLGIFGMAGSFLVYKFHQDHPVNNQSIVKQIDFGPVPPIFKYSEKDGYMILILYILCRLDNFNRFSRIILQNSPFVHWRKFFGGTVDLYTKNINANKVQSHFILWGRTYYSCLEQSIIHMLFKIMSLNFCAISLSDYSILTNISNSFD